MNFKKFCKDTVVLWRKTGINAYNELSFSVAEEINVRWEDRQEIFISANGKELVSRAILHVLEDLVPDSFMCNCRLTDITTEEKADPRLVEEAYAIKSSRKLPDIKGKYFLRKVYLHGGSVS